MTVERIPGDTTMIDVLDRVLDKGIVVDAWAQVRVAGIELVTVDARIVVASIETYVRFAEQVGAVPHVATPRK